MVIDEIGLAEISDHNPLKVLHSYLEPHEENKKLAFIGLSNWTLDASKMNRGINLSRPELSKQELLDTAYSIRKTYKNIDSSVE